MPSARDSRCFRILKTVGASFHVRPIKTNVASEKPLGEVIDPEPAEIGVVIAKTEEVDSMRRFQMMKRYLKLYR